MYVSIQMYSKVYDSKEIEWKKINLHKKDKNDNADVRCKSYGVELKVKLKCNRNL